MGKLTTNEEVCVFFELLRVLAHDVVETQVEFVVSEHLLRSSRCFAAWISVRLLQEKTLV